VKVLLTGANGFIGSHVAKVLARHGHEVSPAATACDVAIHLAWYVEPGKYLESPLNDQCRDDSLALVKSVQCRRWVVVGTSFEYAPSTQPLREVSPTGPRTRYARCKLELFQALQRLRVELAWPRLFYLYGPGEDARRFVPNVINALLEGRPAPLTAGEEVRDYLHVEDVAEAIVAVATSTLTGAVNIASGQPVTVRDVATKIAGIIRRPELLQFGAYQAAATDEPHVVADVTKLNAIWRPRVGLEDGLAGTIEWWRQARSARSGR